VLRAFIDWFKKNYLENDASIVLKLQKLTFSTGNLSLFI